MNFLYYLSCIGNPNILTKIYILRRNLLYIFNNIQCYFDIIVNLYETDKESYNLIETLLSKLKFINTKFIYVKKGILSEVFLSNKYNKHIFKYDYILFILDDIEIENLDINEIIRVKKKYNLEIISPKVIYSTHPQWNSLRGNVLTINNFLEVYCLLMNPYECIKFFSLHTIKNKWMWGADLIFGYFNIKVGTYYKYTVIHRLSSKANKIDAITCMNEYLEKYSLSQEYLSNKYNYSKETINLDKLE